MDILLFSFHQEEAIFIIFFHVGPRMSANHDYEADWSAHACTWFIFKPDFQNANQFQTNCTFLITWEFQGAPAPLCLSLRAEFCPCRVPFHMLMDLYAAKGHFNTWGTFLACRQEWTLSHWGPCRRELPYWILLRDTLLWLHLQLYCQLSP